MTESKDMEILVKQVMQTLRDADPTCGILLVVAKPDSGDFDTATEGAFHMASNLSTFGKKLILMEIARRLQVQERTHRVEGSHVVN